MNFYKHKFSVHQNKTTVFNYLCNKKYITIFFSQDSEEKVEIISDNDHPEMLVGEKFQLLVEDREMILIFQFEVVAINPEELIYLKFNIADIIDKETDNDDEQADAEEFIANFLGYDFDYYISIKEKKEQIIVTEKCTVTVKSLFKKLFLKAAGFYLRNSQRKVYQQIIKEIEAI